MTLGIDIGATNTRYGVLSNGSLEQKKSTESRIESPDELVAQCKEIVNEFPDIDRVGIVMPGFLDHDGVVYSPPNFPHWGTVNMRELLSKTLNKPFILDRDAVGALFGEWKLGAAKESTNVVLLTLGTGIGGAAVVDGKILRGHHGFSGEFGHALVGPSSRQGGIGLEGSAEAWASGKAMEQGVSLEEATTVFSRLLKSLELIFDPELFVLSGGLTKNSDYINQATRKAKIIGLQTDVKVGKLGEWAGVVGAALLASHKI